jgi:hypothetical protein
MLLFARSGTPSGDSDTDQFTSSSMLMLGIA